MKKSFINRFYAVCLAASFALQPLAHAAENGSKAESPFATVTGFVGKASDAAQSLVFQGLSYLGVRYVPGGSSPEAGFDCSGMVRKAFSDALGLSMPHNAAAMAQMGQRISTDELKPGDLVFFNTMRRTFSHVGIYLGDNRFVHAPSSGGAVRVDSMQEAYWKKNFNGARRILGDDGRVMATQAQ